MPPTINQEWLNQNSLRAYPFKEDMRKVPVDSDGNLVEDVVLPNYLIVDFILTMAGTIPQVYLSQLAMIGNLLTFVLSDGSDNQITVLSVDLSSHNPYDAYAVIGTGDYDDVRGQIVLGNLSNLSNDLAEGLYSFTLDAAEFEPSTVRPALRAVRSLRTVNEGSESDFIYGHVKLLNGTNIQLTYLPAYNTIRIDAIDGTGLNEECECEEEIGQTNIVRTINGIPLEDAIVTGDGQCVEVRAEGNRLVISDLCSTPCCDCPELEFLTESLKILEATISNLEGYAHQLHERITNFVNSFVLTVGTGYG